MPNLQEPQMIVDGHGNKFYVQFFGGGAGGGGGGLDVANLRKVEPPKPLPGWEIGEYKDCLRKFAKYVKQYGHDVVIADMKVVVREDAGNW